MRRVLAALGLTAALCGCAGAPKAEVDAADDANIFCIERNAVQLDDQISPATAVAVGVAAACSSELLEAEKVAGQNFSYDAFVEFKQRMEAIQIQTATEVVLKERSFKRGTSKEPTSAPFALGPSPASQKQ